MKTAPHPLQVVSFFLMGLNFAVWQPFSWWRAAAAVLMLGFGCYGVYVLRRSKRKESGQEPCELE
ncbi:hypothetical protein [Paenarthrobacter nitroguajacolicus]|uniref:hypothetical protein n=1 Tax=Paenarthrobacter nitroguajacolicus TaxID=211146 RepID=UPI0028639A5E|nr:hypothetical protein [Paenarthrobacter nitroguajacolicus]MDR6637400.1 hypothetical protein [Paenarthrobacter nitroguajacolicus]